VADEQYEEINKGLTLLLNETKMSRDNRNVNYRQMIYRRVNDGGFEGGRGVLELM
jgi:hypothetical protein